MTACRSTRPDKIAVVPFLKDHRIRGRLHTSCTISLEVQGQFKFTRCLAIGFGCLLCFWRWSFLGWPLPNDASVGALRDWVKEITRSSMLLCFCLVEDDELAADVGAPTPAESRVGLGLLVVNDPQAQRYP